MLNLITAGPGVATLATAGTICEDGAEDTESNPHSYEEVAAVATSFFGWRSEAALPRSRRDLSDLEGASRFALRGGLHDSPRHTTEYDGRPA